MSAFRFCFKNRFSFFTAIAFRFAGFRETVKFRDQEILAFSKCGFYVLGSNDAEHFILLSGREKIEDVRDLITKMNKTKAFKYFMIALVGGVRTDVALNYIEFMVDETYTNRLR